MEGRLVEPLRNILKEHIEFPNLWKNYLENPQNNLTLLNLVRKYPFLNELWRQIKILHPRHLNYIKNSLTENNEDKILNMMVLI